MAFLFLVTQYFPVLSLFFVIVEKRRGQRSRPDSQNSYWLPTRSFHCAGNIPAPPAGYTAKNAPFSGYFMAFFCWVYRGCIWYNIWGPKPFSLGLGFRVRGLETFGSQKMDTFCTQQLSPEP